MRLIGKQILLLVSDGVDQGEVEQLRQAFEREDALVLVSCPHDAVVVETVYNGRRGKDIAIDVPLEVAAEVAFDGLVIPDGLLSSLSLRRDRRVVDLVAYFHQRRLPIFASGNAVEILYESQVLFQQIVVREGSPLSLFVEKAVGVLLDKPSAPYGGQFAYRPTMEA